MKYNFINPCPVDCGSTGGCDRCRTGGFGTDTRPTPPTEDNEDWKRKILTGYAGEFGGYVRDESPLFKASTEDRDWKAPQNMEKEKLVQKFNEDWPSTHSYTAGKMTEYVRELVDTAYSLGEKAMLEKITENVKEAIKDTQTIEDLTARLFSIITRFLSTLTTSERVEKIIQDWDKQADDLINN